MEGVLITRDREFQAEKAVVNFLTRLLLQAQTSWSCQFFTNLLFLCLKDTKGACSGHFFKPYIIEALVRKKLNFFPSMSCLPSCVCSVMSHSLQPHGLCPWPLCPWIFQARILKWVSMPFSRASSSNIGVTESFLCSEPFGEAKRWQLLKQREGYVWILSYFHFTCL